MRPLIVFAHGAGAPSSSEWMVRWRARLESLGDVHSFDYPYMTLGRRRPDPLPTLLAAHRAACEAARSARVARLVLVGKSLGARVGCHLAAETDLPVSALVCLGYPLVGQTGKTRDAVLLALRTPVLFVQGSRDPLCPLDRLQEVRRKMSAPSELFVVDGGDHSLLLPRARLRASGRSQDEVDATVLDAIRRFLAGT